jgi:hypothetical protein
MFAYGQVIDTCNEYYKARESTTFECLLHFVKAIKEVFELEFLKKPTQVDLEKQLKANVKRGWPSMFASLDCMHYHWKNCLVVLQGSFIDKDGSKLIILEAIVD